MKKVDLEKYPNNSVSIDRIQQNKKEFAVQIVTEGKPDEAKNCPFCLLPFEGTNHDDCKYEWVMIDYEQVDPLLICPICFQMTKFSTQHVYCLECSKALKRENIGPMIELASPYIFDMDFKGFNWDNPLRYIQLSFIDFAFTKRINFVMRCDGNHCDENLFLRRSRKNLYTLVEMRERQIKQFCSKKCLDGYINEEFRTDAFGQNWYRHPYDLRYRDDISMSMTIRDILHFRVDREPEYILMVIHGMKPIDCYYNVLNRETLAYLDDDTDYLFTPLI